MVRIRLRRVGSKKQPSYRIVVADIRSPRDGRYIEVIGFYNPRTEPATIQVQEDRALYWLNVGAQPSDTVKYILTQTGTLDRLARLHKGEELEVLVAEAEAAAAEAPAISPKTSHAPKAKKDKPAAEEPVAEPESEEETAEPAEEPVVEPEAEAEKETAEPEEEAEAAE